MRVNNSNYSGQEEYGEQRFDPANNDTQGDLSSGTWQHKSPGRHGRVTRVAVPQAQAAPVHFRDAAGTAASGQKVLERGRLIVKVMLIFPE